jgi:endonuclease III
MSRLPNHIAARYLDAKDYLLESGYATEIDWQDDVDIGGLTEMSFLREAAWVVLSAGMAERVVRSVFPQVTKSFCDWASASSIVRNSVECRTRAMQVFRHRGKVDAILKIAYRAHRLGFPEIHGRIIRSGPVFLRTLPYIGKVTAFHLAKNIGIDVAKPDRHLTRVSTLLGFSSPSELCSLLAEELAEKRAVVDLVIWRFATVRPDYLEFFGGSSGRQFESPSTTAANAEVL